MWPYKTARAIFQSSICKWFISNASQLMEWGEQRQNFSLALRSFSNSKVYSIQIIFVCAFRRISRWVRGPLFIFHVYVSSYLKCQITCSCVSLIQNSAFSVIWWKIEVFWLLTKVAHFIYLFLFTVFRKIRLGSNVSMKLCNLSSSF